MSKLEELINKLCPNGVEFKKLSELMTPNPKSKIGAKKAEQMLKGEYPFYTSGKSVYYINEHMVDGENIFVNDGGQADIKYYDGKSSYADHVISFRPINVNGKYLYYILMKKKEYINEKMFRGSGIKNINKNDFFNMLLPVPPLEVQCEIVRILDNFTLLSAELSAELKARQQQYKYYRDILLSFNETVPRKKLIDISNISRGKRVTKKDLDDSNEYPVYQNSLALMGYYNDYNYEENKTYVISAGAAGEIGFCKEKFWAADDCLVIYNLKDILDKYVYYYLLSKQDYIKANVRKASIPRLSRIIIENIEIPIPSIERQEEIVYILDRLDKLCNDITSGIPAEIEKRQKQYEHYRDKLLTFKELKS